MKYVGVILLGVLLSALSTYSAPYSVSFRFTSKAGVLTESTVAFNATSCLFGTGNVEEEVGIGANTTGLRYSLNGTFTGFIALSNNYSAAGIGFIGKVSVEFEGSSGYAGLTVRSAGRGEGILTAGYWIPSHGFVKRVLEGPYEFGFELEIKPLPFGPAPANITRACPVSPV